MIIQIKRKNPKIQIYHPALPWEMAQSLWCNLLQPSNHIASAPKYISCWTWSVRCHRLWSHEWLGQINNPICKFGVSGNMALTPLDHIHTAGHSDPQNIKLIETIQKGFPKTCGLTAPEVCKYWEIFWQYSYVSAGCFAEIKPLDLFAYVRACLVTFLWITNFTGPALTYECEASNSSNDFPRWEITGWIIEIFPIINTGLGLTGQVELPCRIADSSGNLKPLQFHFPFLVLCLNTPHQHQADAMNQLNWCHKPWTVEQDHQCARHQTTLFSHLHWCKWKPPGHCPDYSHTTSQAWRNSSTPQRLLHKHNGRWGGEGDVEYQ